MRGRTRIGWLATALLLAAFVLRVIDVERRPLHFDEGINVTMGHRSPTDILRITRETFDNDPPGHRMALGVWMALAGPSALSIRIFSVFFSVLAVAGLYRILRTLRLPRAPSLIAATLLAISPYAIDYAQQAKGYAMGAGLAMLSWWAWIVLFAPRAPHRRRAFLAYVVVTALALTTHYYMLFLLPTQWLWALGARFDMVRRLVRRSRADAICIGWGLAAQVLAGLPIGAWILLMLDSLMRSTARSSTKFQPPALFDALRRILTEMSAGQFMAEAPALLCALLVTMLALIGARRLWRLREGTTPARGAFWFGAAFVVPLAGAMIIQQRVTFFFPRFLLFALPSLFALLAGNAIALKRAAGVFPNAQRWAPLALTAGVFLAGNLIFYSAPIDSQNDFRPLVAAMRPYIQHGDAALGTYIWMEGMFDSYAPETVTKLEWVDETYSPETVDELLAPVAQEHTRIWSLNFRRNPDAPDTLSVVWLKRNAAYAWRHTAGATTVLLFDTRFLAGVRDAPPATASATFNGSIRLNYSPIDTTVRSGDTVADQLTWTALQPQTEYVQIYVHLVGPSGQLVAQADGDAVNGLAPNTTWTPAHPVADRNAMLIPYALPQGRYELIIGLYHPSDGSRLHTETGADGVPLAMITVSR